MRNPYWYFTPYPHPPQPAVYYPQEKPTKKPIQQPALQPRMYPDCVIEEKYCDYFDIGDTAPDFSLQGIVDGEPEEVSLSDYLGQWVVLFFYGSDFTFV